MKNKQWEFFYHHIEEMITDFKKINPYHEELREHIFDFISRSITKSSHNLSIEDEAELFMLLSEVYINTSEVEDIDKELLIEMLEDIDERTVKDVIILRNRVEIYTKCDSGVIHCREKYRTDL